MLVRFTLDKSFSFFDRNSYSSRCITVTIQVQNVRSMMMNQGGGHMMSLNSGAVTPGAAGDEVRVDCCLMTSGGTTVVTGSSLGPPQVWDMQVCIIV